VEIWPNFIIVGAQKTGTTALYDYLKQHPQVFMPKLKEPGFFRSFVPPGVFPEPIREKKEYLSLFQDVKGEVAIGEASGMYLDDPGTPKLIREAIPNCQIIIVLRDPVERTYSDYLQMKRGGREKQTFSEVIRKNIVNIKDGPFLTNRKISKYVRGSFYAEKIKLYLDVFGKDKVKIIISEEFLKNVKSTVKNILNFLGIEELHDFDDSPKNYYQETQPVIQGLVDNKIVRNIGYKIIPWRYRIKIAEKILWKTGEKPTMIQEDRTFLENIFREDVLETQKILDQKLPWFINKNE